MTPKTNETILKAVQHFDYLYQRWQDESQYEDFQQYIDSMRDILPKGSQIIRMTKRPFRLTYWLNGRKLSMTANKDGVRYIEPEKLDVEPTYTKE